MFCSPLHKKGPSNSLVVDEQMIYHKSIFYENLELVGCTHLSNARIQCSVAPSREAGSCRCYSDISWKHLNEHGLCAASGDISPVTNF